MKKRGQAATEFLTTYGWAILILAAAIVAIISLNIFNPKVPNNCVGVDPITCDDVQVTTSPNNVNLVLTASGISTTDVTTVDEINLNYPVQVICTDISYNPTPDNLENNIQKVVSCSCWPEEINLDKNNKFSGTATISYNLPGSTNPYTSKVIFSGTVEEGDGSISPVCSGT